MNGVCVCYFSYINGWAGPGGPGPGRAGWVWGYCLCHLTSRSWVGEIAEAWALNGSVMWGQWAGGTRYGDTINEDDSSFACLSILTVRVWGFDK